LNTAGSLIGTPTVAGNFNFTIQVQGGNPVQTATKAFQLSINSSLGIITLATLPSATVNVSYSTTLSAAGGTPPYTWNNIGLPLPAGLTLSSAGVLSGTPTAVGNFSLTIQVADSFSPPQQASRAFTLSIGINPVITTSTLATGAVGITYGPQTLTATGGVQPYIWSVVAGTLPTGLNLSSDGILSGTPVVAGTFNVTLGINDSSANTLTATKAFTMTIHPAISITTTSPLPLGVAGALYNRRVEATGPPAITWSVFSGVLPPGISLAPGGTLGGIPNLAGTFDFILQADSTNPAQNARQSLQIVINPALSISTLVALPDAPVGSAYSTQLVAVGGVAPYNWVTQGGIIPPGLTLSNTGLLSGTPLGVGSFTFTTQVSDSFTPTQQTSRTFNIVVGNPLTITTASLPNAFQNLAYSQQIVATGTAPLTWSVTSGTLPTGLTLASNGTVQGTPTGLGSSSFTATVIDGRGATNARNFTIVVDPAIGTFSVPGLPANIRPTQPSDVEVTLSAPHPSTLTGKLVLTFTSKAEVAGDDPNLKFSTNSRTVDFTVPANTTSAVFPSRIMLLPGTVAGTVTLTANIDNGPSLPVATVEVSALAPQITNVAGVRTLQGLEVQITGYASSRRVTNVEFSFEVKSGNSTITVPLTRNVDSDFAAWYRSSSSIPFGSAFSFVQSFTVTQGDLSAIQAVIVRLTNAQGSTTTARIPLQ